MISISLTTGTRARRGLSVYPFQPASGRAMGPFAQSSAAELRRKSSTRLAQAQLREQNVSHALLQHVHNVLDQVEGLLVELKDHAVAATTAETRGPIQTEVKDLVAQIDRLAGALQVHTDSRGLPTLERVFSAARLDSATAAALGLAKGARVAAVRSEPMSVKPLELGSVALNGSAVRPTLAQDDGFSSHTPEASAIAKALAINSLPAATNVEAQVLPTEARGTGPVAAGLLRTGALTINTIEIAPVQVADRDRGGHLRERINARSTDTGVEAALDLDHRLIMRANDGRNISLGLSSNGRDITSLSDGVYFGRLLVSSSSELQISGSDPERAGLTARTVHAIIRSVSTLDSLDVTTAQGAQDSLLAIREAQRSIGRQRRQASRQLRSSQHTIERLRDASLRQSAPRASWMGGDAELGIPQVPRNLSRITLAHGAIPHKVVLNLLA